MDEEKVETVIRFRPERYEQLKVWCARRHRRMWEVVDEALEIYFKLLESVEGRERE